jgi:hypothetical protein
MTLLAECHYFGGDMSPGELAGRMEKFARDLSDRVLYMLDGANVSAEFLDPDVELSWRAAEGGTPKRLTSRLLSKKQYPALRLKGSSPTNPTGLELHVKSSDTTNGRVCVVRGDDPDQDQVISLIPGVQGTDDNGTVSAPLADLILTAKSGNVVKTDRQFQSTVATGTAPLVIASTTKVDNLNADLVDGAHAAEFAFIADDNTFTQTNDFSGAELLIPIAAPGVEDNGSIYFDTGATKLKVHYNGTTYEFTPSGP